MSAPACMWTEALTLAREGVPVFCTSAESALVDPRLAFLARAHARFILVEAGEMSLDEALDGLVEPICDCQRWPLAAQWERTHPPVVRARAAERRR